MSIFTKQFLMAATAALALSLAGCGDSGGGGGGNGGGGNGVTPQAVEGQLPGTWTFKQAVYTPHDQQRAQPADGQPQAQPAGQPIVHTVTGTLKLTANTFDMDRTENGQNRKVKGTYTAQGNTLKVKSEGETEENSVKYKIDKQNGQEVLFFESQIEEDGVLYDSTDILSRAAGGAQPAPGANPAAPGTTPTPTPAPMP